MRTSPLRHQRLARSPPGLPAERARLPVLPVLFVLTRPGYEPQGGRLRLEIGGELAQEMRFREVPLWEQQPGPVWEAVPALMPLYPLTQHGRRPVDAVAHAVGVIRERVPEGPERANELFLLSIFGKLAYRGLDVVSMIGRQVMMESEIGRMLRREDMRETVLAVVDERFGAEATQSVNEAVNEVEDVEQLKQLVRVAARCTSIEEFRGALSPPTPPRRRRSR